MPNEKGSNSAERKTYDDELETQLDHLYRFAGAVGSTLRVDLLVADALLPLLSIAGGDKVIIFLCRLKNVDKQIVRHIGFDDMTPGEIDPDDVANLGTGLNRTPDDSKPPEWVFRAIGGEVENPAVVPLWAYGRPLGLMVLSRKKTFDPRTLKLLHTAGRQLGLAIENARLFGDLEMSYHHLLYNQEEMISSERMAAIGSLAATMAHEIRNPLATIFSSLSQIKKHAHVTGDAATLLQIAEEEAVRMNRIISGLLEFARPGVPKFYRINLVDIVKDVADGISRFMESECAVKIEVTPDNAVMTADADAAMVKKAVHHVLDNAVAAVDPKKGKVEIKITDEVEQHHKRDVVKITFMDNGHGVTRDIQNKVFEPFYSTKPSGTGLGLPTVARIVNDHGGMVNFNSQYKQGTTVVLTFFKEHRPAGENRADD